MVGRGEGGWEKGGREGGLGAVVVVVLGSL